jgi:hemerythrin-like metal-binding protein
MFDWNDSYSVNIASIDGQHKNLFRIAEELHAAMLKGTAQASTSKILDRLVQYVGVHFAYEERLMQAAHYPAFPAHKAMHDELTKQVLQFQEDLQKGKHSLTINLLQFLKKWLVNHIEGEDQKYAPFVNAKTAA